MERALAVKPEDRHQSAGDLVRDLEGGLRTRLWRAPRVRVSRRQWIYAGIGTAGVAGVVGIFRLREWEAKLPESPLVMMTPIKNLLGTPGAALTAGTLDGLLANQLQQSPHLRLLTKEGIQAGWERISGSSGVLPAGLAPAAARDIALREGAHFVVFGTADSLADQTVLQLQVELMGNDPGHARRSWFNRFSVQREADLPSAVEEGGAWIRRTVGESAADIETHSRRPEELTTASWQALQEFTRANEAWKLGQADAALLHLKLRWSWIRASQRRRRGWRTFLQPCIATMRPCPIMPSRRIDSLQEPDGPGIAADTGVICARYGAVCRG